MGEYPIEENDVLKILNTVSIARRQIDLVSCGIAFPDICSTPFVF